MRALVFGATGMVGQAVLLECLADPVVTEVVAVGRNPVRQRHPKLTQLVRPDMFDLGPIAERLIGFDACFFCLGVSSVGMREDEYRRLTYDLTTAVAELLAPLNPSMAFEYVSGEGTDSTEQGRTMWARVKGRTENAVIALPFDGYAIRPGFIQPRRGVRPKVRLYALLYRATGWLFPVIRRVLPGVTITSDDLGKAMIRIAETRPAARFWSTSELTALLGRPR